MVPSRCLKLLTSDHVMKKNSLINSHDTWFCHIRSVLLNRHSTRFFMKRMSYSSKFWWHLDLSWREYPGKLSGHLAVSRRVYLIYCTVMKANLFIKRISMKKMYRATKRAIPSWAVVYNQTTSHPNVLEPGTVTDSPLTWHFRLQCVQAHTLEQWSVTKKIFWTFVVSAQPLPSLHDPPCLTSWPTFPPDRLPNCMTDCLPEWLTVCTAAWWYE
jgi:hypothetical protein